MTTLLGNELFDYLTHLEEEVDKRISTSNKGSLQYLIHSQMNDIIKVEKDFLKYINSNKTQPVLSISPNGLPSVASLNPDLEKMCELAEDESSFVDVAQRFRKGINGKNRGEEGHLYVPVSEDEWSKELINRTKEKSQSQVGFVINETDDGKFELAVREDTYLQGYDKHSKEFPVLIREGRIRYHVVWNRLVDDLEESFYAPNTALVLQGKPQKPSKKLFDDINRNYSFSGSDFKGAKTKRNKNITFDTHAFAFFMREPLDYASFLSAGTNARVGTTENILKAIEKGLDKQVAVRGIRKNDLGQVLAFATVPFKNAPKTTPKQDDFYTERGELKIPTKYELIFTVGRDKIGEIEYILPHNKRVYDDYRFTKGGIDLHILGSAILNEEQYHNLQTELKKIKKRFIFNIGLFG